MVNICTKRSSDGTPVRLLGLNLAETGVKDQQKYEILHLPLVGTYEFNRRLQSTGVKITIVSNVSRQND